MALLSVGSVIAQAKIIVDTTNGCSPLTVKFTDQSADQARIVSRTWDLENGNPPVRDSVSVQANYSVPRTYNIKLVVTYSNGVQATANQQITVHPKPVVDFTASDTLGCAPLPVKFTDKSTTQTGTLKSWTWNLDLSTSSLQNPVQSYPNTGSYRINLVVMNSWGCIGFNLKTDYIRVVNKPSVNFTVKPQSTCNDTLTVICTNNSVDAPNYLWNFGDDSTSRLVNPSHFYTRPGSYTISLLSVVAPGCDDRKNAVVNIGKPTASVSPSFPDTVCEDAAVGFSGTASPAGSTGRWYFSDRNQTIPGTQVGYTFVNPGQFDVYFIAGNSWGCTDTVKKRIFVRARPLVRFSANPPNTCNDSLTVFLTNSSTGASSYLWNFGDGATSTEENPLHFYSSPNTYAIRLSSGVEGCEGVQTQTINVGKPKAQIISPPDTVCENAPVTLSGRVTPSTITGRWIFSDKNQSRNGNQVTYTFSDPGRFNVYFIAVNSWGCSDTATATIYVQAAPKPQFTIDTAVSCQVPFTLQTTNLSPGDNLDFTWNFGDGKPAMEGLFPPHTYTAYGTFSITLTAKDTSRASGCSTSITKTDTVRIVRPAATITAAPYRDCNPPVDINFTVSTNGFLDPPVRYIWKWDDGSSDTTQSPQAPHKYLQAKTYTPTVTIVSNSGCSAIATGSVVLKSNCPPPPDTVILVSYSCSPCNRVILRDTVVNSTVIKWDMGDGTIIDSNAPNPVIHDFPVGKTDYTVYVERKNNVTGIISGTRVVVSILCMTPQISTDKSATCPGDSVRFTVAGIDSSAVSAWVWNFGEGIPRQINNRNQPPYLDGSTAYVYNNPDTFSVKLTVVDRRNCRTTSNFLPIIIHGPRANFTSSPRTTCDSSFMVFFRDSTTRNGNVPVIKWEWDFGDRSAVYPSTKDTLIPRKYMGGTVPITTYDVTLKVTDSLGCTGSITRVRQIALYRPRAAFSSSDTLHCNRFLVRFNSNDTRAVAPVYSWYMGDGTVQNGTNISYTYMQKGIYDVKLVVRDENGCTDSIQKQKYIKIIEPEAHMRIKDSSECWPSPVTFEDSSYYATKYLWDFGDNRTPSQDRSRPRVYDGPGVYLVTLVVTGPDGCLDTTSQYVKIKGSRGEVLVDSLVGCKPYTAGMRVINRYNIVDYRWDYGDGSVVNFNPADSVVNHPYRTEGRYRPNVVYRSSEGCLLSDSSKKLIIVDLAKAGFSATPALICDSGTVTIVDSSKAAYFSSLTRYAWDFGNGQKSGSAVPFRPVYNAPGNYTIRLAVESAYGCKDSVIQRDAVKVSATPLVSVSGTDVACKYTVHTFKADISSSDSVSLVKWSVNGVEKGAGDSFRLAFNDAGALTITVLVRTKNGCERSFDKRIIVQPVPVPVPDAAPDTVVCVNSVVKLRASDGVRYSWSPAATLQFPDSAEPIARPPRGTTKYYVAVTNAFGCTATDSLTIQTNDSVFVSVDPVAEVCLHDSIQLQATSNAKSILWSPAEGLTGTTLLRPYAKPEKSTAYTLVGFSSNVCPNDTATLFVKVNPLPVIKASARPDTAVMPRVMVTLIATAAGSNLYQWAPASPQLYNATSSRATWIADVDRTFRVTVTDQNGCRADDTVHIRVECDTGNVRVPSAFTPAKSINRYFRPLALYKSDPKVVSFRVYNRWGNVVYEVKNVFISQIKGWDGRLADGTEQGPDTFVWVLEMKCSNKPAMKKGTVILIR